MNAILVIMTDEVVTREKPSARTPNRRFRPGATTLADYKFGRAVLLPDLVWSLTAKYSISTRQLEPQV